MVGISRLVHITDHPLRRLCVHAEIIDTVDNAVFVRRIDKNSDQMIAILQNCVRASADNDAGFLHGKFFYHLALRLKQGILRRRGSAAEWETHEQILCRLLQIACFL